MVVKDSPAHGPLLHDQGEWAACRDGSVSHQDETSGHQRQGGRQSSNLDLFEMQAVATGSRSKPGRIVLPDEVEAMPGPPAVDEGGRALGRVVGHERLEVTPIPVSRRSVELAGNLGRGGRAARGWPGCAAGWAR